MFNFKTMRKHLVTVSLLLTSLFTNAYALNNNSDFNNDNFKEPSHNKS